MHGLRRRRRGLAVAVALAAVAVLVALAWSSGPRAAEAPAELAGDPRTPERPAPLADVRAAGGERAPSPAAPEQDADVHAPASTLRARVAALAEALDAPHASRVGWDLRLRSAARTELERTGDAALGELAALLARQELSPAGCVAAAELARAVGELAGDRAVPALPAVAANALRAAAEERERAPLRSAVAARALASAGDPRDLEALCAELEAPRPGDRPEIAAWALGHARDAALAARLVEFARGPAGAKSPAAELALVAAAQVLRRAGEDEHDAAARAALASLACDPAAPHALRLRSVHALSALGAPAAPSAATAPGAARQADAAAPIDPPRASQAAAALAAVLRDARASPELAAAAAQGCAALAGADRGGGLAELLAQPDAPHALEIAEALASRAQDDLEPGTRARVRELLCAAADADGVSSARRRAFAALALLDDPLDRARFERAARDERDPLVRELARAQAR